MLTLNHLGCSVVSEIFFSLGWLVMQSYVSVELDLRVKNFRAT